MDKNHTHQYLILIRDWLQHLNKGENEIADAMETFIQEEQFRDYIKHDPKIGSLYMDIDAMREQMLFLKTDDEVDKEFSEAIKLVDELIQELKNRI